MSPIYSYRDFIYFGNFKVAFNTNMHEVFRNAADQRKSIVQHFIAILPLLGQRISFVRPRTSYIEVRLIEVHCSCHFKYRNYIVVTILYIVSSRLSFLSAERNDSRKYVCVRRLEA